MIGNVNTPPPVDTGSTSAWDHVSVVAAGAGAIVLGMVDLYLKQKLTGGADVGLVAAGFGALGLKGAFGGLLPR